MKRLGVILLQFVAGASLIAGLILLLPRTKPAPRLPAGWLLIRPPTDVMTLAEAGDAVWSGGRDGVVRLDKASGRIVGTLAADVPLVYVSTILMDPAGAGMWIGHGNGLSRFDGQRWRTYTTRDGLPDNQVLALCRARTGELWAGTAHGLARLARGTWTRCAAPNGPASEAVSTILEDRRGRLWFGDGYSASGGLGMFDGRAWRTFGIADGLAHACVNALCEDRDGRIWFATGFSSRGAASRLDGAAWTTLTQADGLAGAKVRSVFQDRGGAMWLGSEYDGIARLHGAVRQVLKPADGLAGWEVKAMLQDAEGRLWLGTENGITRLDRDALACLASAAAPDGRYGAASNRRMQAFSRAVCGATTASMRRRGMNRPVRAFGAVGTRAIGASVPVPASAPNTSTKPSPPITYSRCAAASK